MNYQNATKQELIKELQELHQKHALLKTAYSKDISDLKQAEKVLLKSEEKWRYLVTTIPDFIALHDLEGRYLFLNHYAEGFSEKDVVGESLYNFISEDSKEEYRRNFEACIQTKLTRRFVFSAYGNNKVSRIYENYLVPILEEDRIVNVMAIAMDITELKLAEKANRILERFPTENPDPVLRIDQSGLLLFANKASLKLLTWKLQIGKKAPSVLKKIITDSLMDRKAKKFEIENNNRIFSFKIVPVVGDNYVNLYGRDITGHKQVEKELRKSKKLLEDLNKQLIGILEKERSQIGLNLHDDLGQKLTALYLDIAWLKRRIGVQSHVVRKKLEEMCQIINETIESIKEVSSFMKPSILFDLGLVPAFKWQLKNFENKSGVKCNFYYEPEELNIDNNRSLMLFRMLQESLTNISRHSKATAVEVNLQLVKKSIELLIKDNGIGITEEKINSFTSMGLTGIKERARSINGKVSIEGERGSGTIIKVTIPFKKIKKL